jgi:hypothetical protein
MRDHGVLVESETRVDKTQHLLISSKLESPTRRQTGKSFRALEAERRHRFAGAILPGKSFA